jgi:hypothetical protein
MHVVRGWMVGSGAMHLKRLGQKHLTPALGIGPPVSTHVSQTQQDGLQARGVRH